MLIQGTKALSRRDFDVHITPTTRDELAQLAENFNAMAHTLNTYETMRQQWITDISHELRTPLAVLQGEIEALQDGVREPTPENLASLQGEILRLKRLVEDLHLISLADSDQLFLNLKPIVILPLVEQIIEGFQPRFTRRGIALELDLRKIAGVQINADGGRLGQVISNILDNAGKYMHAPGTLKAIGKTEGTDLILTFEDSGPGAPPETHDRLFDRLYRVDSSRSRQTGGSGLGLSICRNIIENHNGGIWAASSSIGGMLIGIRLPLAKKTS
jgi:two-component system sensor histidine kinase BaeS